MMTEQLLLQLKEYEGNWVALIDSGDDEMSIVAGGDDAAEVRERAEQGGYKDVTLMKVLLSDAVYVPLP